MKTIFKLLFFICMINTVAAQSNFKTDQLKFERVKSAYDEKWNGLQQELQKAGLNDHFQLFINAYKAEGKLEIWLKPKTSKQYRLFKTYNFCAHSGKLGPKVIEGDLQTPEGFYQINVFNPQSTYHLSLGIDYPNKVDLARTGKDKSPGGDIYIHGDCVTVGCIPLTDQLIKEVYILAVEARNNGQNEIPVYIFPFKMTDANLKSYTSRYPQQANFWKTLQKGYQAFEQHKMLPIIKQEAGAYAIK